MEPEVVDTGSTFRGHICSLIILTGPAELSRFVSFSHVGQC